MNGGHLTPADLLRIAEEFPAPAKDPLALPDLSTMRVGLDLASDPDYTAFKVRLALDAGPFLRHLSFEFSTFGESLRRFQIAVAPLVGSRGKRRRDAQHHRSPHRRRRHGRA